MPAPPANVPSLETSDKGRPADVGPANAGDAPRQSGLRELPRAHGPAGIQPGKFRRHRAMAHHRRRPCDRCVRRDYWNAVLTLQGLNSAQLELVTQEFLDEWNPQIEAGQGDRTDSFYLVEFTRRLNVAIDEMNDILAQAFSASEDVLEQSEDEFQGTTIIENLELLLIDAERRLDRVVSFSTTLVGSQPSSPKSGERSNGSIPDSPVSSMERLSIIHVIPLSNCIGLESPRTGRRLTAERLAISFLERLGSLIPGTTDASLVPTSSNPPYVYGVLSFAIDWEVWRVDRHTSLDLRHPENRVPPAQPAHDHLKQGHLRPPPGPRSARRRPSLHLLHPRPVRFTTGQHRIRTNSRRRVVFAANEIAHSFYVKAKKCLLRARFMRQEARQRRGSII